MLRVTIFLVVAACAAAIYAPNLLPLLVQQASRPATPAALPAAPAVASAERVAANAPSEDGGRSVEIAADAHGQYSADVMVNGSSVRMMIDTGATFVALSADTAQRIGVHVADADYTARVRTANGMARAAPVTLVGIRLGEVYVPAVQGLVLERQAGPVDLLGMSFLKRLAAVDQRRGMLILRQ
ncbi:MAG TPA: TIGR02281 family clan AA aspartic protease [Roseiarcus sp.]|nr:TIGR02281 family clan AA aspartic protease [Roseiarcus sp.]